MPKTVVKFTLPFVTVEEGEYPVSISGKTAKITISFQQNLESFEKITKMKFHSSGGKVSLSRDPHGIANYTNVSIEFPYYYDVSKDGGFMTTEFSTTHPLKQDSIVYLNRLIEVIRWLTARYWIQRVKEQDILSFEYVRIDDEGKGKEGFASDYGASREFPLAVKEQSSVSNEILDILKNEQEIPLDQNLFLDSINYFVHGSFNEAVIIANVALEVLVSEHLFTRFITNGLSEEEASKKVEKMFSKQKKKGLLKILTSDFVDIGKKSLEDSPDLLEKFKNARDVRKNAIHPRIKKLKDDEARQTIETMMQIANWILYNSN